MADGLFTDSIFCPQRRKSHHVETRIAEGG